MMDGFDEGRVAERGRWVLQGSGRQRDVELREMEEKEEGERER
jgi:hypothetical protein